MLRMIAGFELPTSGQILLGGADVTHSAPFDRDVNTVFQDYALFPHMDVIRNVEYGLRVKGVKKPERRERAMVALRLVRLEDFAQRRPNQLSGGQRQRVALARALVNEPKVLLLDEPLGALDLKLREEMQIELKTLQRKVGITFIFVTHDQQEALSMSDRVAVFNNGRVEQLGSPMEVYDHPATEFVARFVGTSNVISGDAAIELLGIPGSFTIRPERITVHSKEQPSAVEQISVRGEVVGVQFLGSEHRVRVNLPGGITIAANVPNGSPLISELVAGSPATLSFSAAHAIQVG